MTGVTYSITDCWKASPPTDRDPQRSARLGATRRQWHRPHSCLSTPVFRRYSDTGFSAFTGLVSPSFTYTSSQAVQRAH